MEWEKAKCIVEFFCERMKEAEREGVKFGMERWKRNMRLIISGPEIAVKEIMKQYYERE